MAKARPDGQITVSDETLQKLLAQYEIPEFQYEVFNLGIENTSIKIITKDKNYVLRIYSFQNKRDEEIELEINFQDYLRQNEIPIPILYKNIQGKELSHLDMGGRKWQYILMEFIEGEHSSEYTSNLQDQLAKLQAKMHLLGIEFAKRSNNILRKIGPVNRPTSSNIVLFESDPEIAKFMQEAEQYSFEINPNLPHGYNHLDLDFGGNIITNKNKILAILDFDDLTYSPCALCLGVTLWHIFYKTEDWNKLRRYINQYEIVRTLNESELATLIEEMLYRNYTVGLVKYTVDKDIETVKRIIKIGELIKQRKFI